MVKNTPILYNLMKGAVLNQVMFEQFVIVVAMVLVCHNIFPLLVSGVFVQLMVHH